jgi:hypothetical protein
MNQRRLNALKRYEIIQKQVEALYEPGNQSKSKIQAYRQINKTQPMGERTFWRIMGTDVNREIKKNETTSGAQTFIPFDFE